MMCDNSLPHIDHLAPNAGHQPCQPVKIPESGMDWSIQDRFSVGPSVSPTGLHFVPVSATLTSLMCARAGPVSSHRSSSSLGNGLSTTTGLLHTGQSCHGEEGLVATGISFALLFWHTSEGLELFLSHQCQRDPLPTGASGSNLLLTMTALHNFRSRIHWPQGRPSKSKHVLSPLAQVPRTTEQYTAIP